MLIVQISDTHITPQGQKAYGIASTAENLKNTIKSINQLSPKPDVVLVTGDVTNASYDEEFEQAVTILDELEAPYFVIPGNHDDRTKIKTVFKNHCPSEDNPNSFIQYIIDDYKVRLIALDSTIPEESGGELCSTRLEWLDQVLSSDTTKPTLIFMHQPPVKIGVIEADIDGFIGAEALGKVIQKYTNIERIICGHVHLQSHTRWHGTVVTTCPSISMELMLDLTLKEPAKFFNEPSSYLLHYWNPYNNLVTHTVNTHEKDGPYLF